MRGAVNICRILFLALAIPSGAGGQESEEAARRRPDLEEAAVWVIATPQSSVEYNYVVTGAVRLLLFWISRDDVGQGYIRIGSTASEAPMEIVQLLMGSDPAKAPMGINRWGAAVEVSRPKDQSGAFFAFMKTSKGESVGDMRGELSREKQTQQHLFEGIISRVSSGRAVSQTVPISSAVDFTIHQFPLAQQMVMERLRTNARPPRTLESGALADCLKADGFLFTVRALIDSALSGAKSPSTKCYIYHARRYMLTLTSCSPVSAMKVALKMRGTTRKIETTYHNLKEGRFRAVNTETGGQTNFRIVFGSAGALRGVPVQIEYQPNWWFKVVLNLKP